MRTDDDTALSASTKAAAGERKYSPTDMERYAKLCMEARDKRLAASGQWVHCSPSLLNAGVSCAHTPRRACACIPENGGHDHWIAHGPADSGQKLTDEPTAFDFKSRLTAYGMLVRALRIVANTTLYDMGQALSLKPSQLSAMEFGRQPVTPEIVRETATYFESLGINNTLLALQAAMKSETPQ